MNRRKERTVAIAIFFETPGVTQQQYEEVIQRLEAAGEGAPAGRLYHVAGPTETSWRVVDVWESQEQFDRFGQTLLPILQEVGFPPLEPQPWPVHNIIVG
jgi:hypothetical protein